MQLLKKGKIKLVVLSIAKYLNLSSNTFSSKFLWVYDKKFPDLKFEKLSYLTPLLFSSYLNRSKKSTNQGVRFFVQNFSWYDEKYFLNFEPNPLFSLWHKRQGQVRAEILLITSFYDNLFYIDLWVSVSKRRKAQILTKTWHVNMGIDIQKHILQDPITHK